MLLVKKIWTISISEKRIIRKYHGHVSFTRRHLHQRADEHKSSSSSIGKHFRDKHSLVPKDLTKNFSALMKCTNKFDCLVYEMFFINELKPTLNVQSDSIRAKVFN